MSNEDLSRHNCPPTPQKRARPISTLLKQALRTPTIPSDFTATIGDDGFKLFFGAPGENPDLEEKTIAVEGMDLSIVVYSPDAFQYSQSIAFFTFNADMWINGKKIYEGLRFETVNVNPFMRYPEKKSFMLYDQENQVLHIPTIYQQLRVLNNSRDEIKKDEEPKSVAKRVCRALLKPALPLSPVEPKSFSRSARQNKINKPTENISFLEKILFSVDEDSEDISKNSKAEKRSEKTDPSSKRHQSVC